MILIALAGPLAAASTKPESIPAELEALGDRAVAAVPGKANRADVDQALALAAKYRRADDPQSEARAWQLAGYFSMLADENAASAGYSDRALGICRRIGDLPCMTRTAINGAVAHKRAENLTAALDRLKLAIAIAARAGETERAEQARYNLANVQHAMGDPIGALATFDALARDYPDSKTALGSLLTSARIHVELGQASLALAKVRAALALLAKNNDVSGWTTDATTTAQSTAGLAYALSGDQARATAYLDRALQRARASDSDEERFDVNARYGWAWQLLNRPDRALPYTRVAFALRGALDERDRLDFLVRAADVFEAAGDSRAASMSRGEALAIARRRQGSALREATASAAASVGLAERDILVGKLTLDQAQARARLDRTRLTGVALIAALLLVSIIVVTRIRIGQLKRQQAAVLDERIRVARDLHDTLIQGFTGVTLQLQQAARAAPADSRLAALARAAAASLTEARNAVWEIRSDVVERGDLRAAIEGWLDTVDAGATTLTRTLDGLPNRLPQQATEDLFRFAQEAVTNALRHAEAATIEVQAVRQGPQFFVLTIMDDGRGFDPQTVEAGRWGLTGMRERVERAGGRLSLTRRPDGGTRVEAIVRH